LGTQFLCVYFSKIDRATWPAGSGQAGQAEQVAQVLSSDLVVDFLKIALVKSRDALRRTPAVAVTVTILLKYTHTYLLIPRIR
jgi:hypothetical protein